MKFNKDFFPCAKIGFNTGIHSWFDVEIKTGINIGINVGFCIRADVEIVNGVYVGFNFEFYTGVNV